MCTGGLDPLEKNRRVFVSLDNFEKGALQKLTLDLQMGGVPWCPFGSRSSFLASPSACWLEITPREVPSGRNKAISPWALSGMRKMFRSWGEETASNRKQNLLSASLKKRRRKRLHKGYPGTRCEALENLLAGKLLGATHFFRPEDTRAVLHASSRRN